ncbi:hypothetical protein A3K34_04300 [candidate division WWE3 bacterium RIFOXYC1_FULL_40_10]|uniref:RNase H type-1 domain-containing protein n=1 Tax=candidate division WWE3 bacterium RIFOXYA2_FULL_46_9 TaxID=1802636 RepID=A0A1F4W1C3_UNCKA|nr:MAG: hypothetical protein A3K58_04300 [candidate division WWE3 bacterium RIFOXYB1_FULL_40_22]OGC62063.1 MAG: hypothetical protein A3K37_04300 [candidate division WWE3 bacterium RIFOXYA1_FULL_40_11]OGC63078.1 MAG: hypothetical protein A2264_00045 [candidate division WWE3 bacterium RIFOXYA2_FULL_46_9]OGC64992.1 MAG: hypothetical protein A2326_03065 [candidate division WWE3 bacterium RIFOXYB2_FULL_41_6]OGC66446.1 MAG: hypothetical protein A3K34_04300 [candidate division WWE3 bacterium RIFOXYC1_
MAKMTLFSDGGARGNPGPAAFGIVLKDENCETIFSSNRYLGTKTNNEAEYMGLIAGLMAGTDKGASEIICYLDSELIVKQLKGVYKVKNDRMKEFWKKAKELERDYKKVTYVHIPRTENKEADALVNEALDEKNGI